jgi:predicted outer membrane repeat protein
MPAASDRALSRRSEKVAPWQRRQWRLLAVIVGVLLLQWLPASSLLPLGPTAAHAQTETVTVCSEGSAFNPVSGTLRYVIASAASGDTVAFSCSGTITLSSDGGGPISIGNTLTIEGGGRITLHSDGSTQLFSVTGTGNLTLNNLTVSGGTASNGGAVDSSGVLTINGSTFSGNTAAGSGGAINSSGTLTINNSTFSGNKANGGNGGALATSGALTVTNSTFSGNSAAGHSGAIDANDPPGAPASVFTGDTFTNNSAAFGGAMAYGTNNPASITNTTFSGNSATSGGDALYPYAPVSLSFATMAGNTGGGSAVDFGPFGSPGLSVAGTILDNTSNCGGGGSITDKGSNLTFQGGNCALSAASDLLGVDPQLGVLTGNGGPTQTMAPSPDSPAVGAASCHDTGGASVTTDQRGASRPASGCTIGAYEADGANGTWVNAQTLNQTSPPYAVDQTVTQHIYSTGQERWYRFLVTPGSSVHVQYSGLPGAVVSLHSDLQSEYNAITNSQNTALSSANNAASGFLPQQFLPQQFLPQQFLPQQFLPQQFLPQQFLPQQFLPPQFLPQQFLPQQFLPQQFLPQQFLPAPYSGAVYASLLAVSAVPNSSVQTIDHDTWNAFGYMYVRVAGPSSLSTPFSLTVTETGGICTGVTNVPFTPPAAPSATFNTLILWDSTRISGSASDVASLTTNVAQFAGRPEVNGAVVDLSGIPGIESAQAQADANPGCPTAKNIVAGDIKAVIQAYRAQNPGLKYIVLVGDDHSIPYYRYPDESGLGPENQYYPPVADNSASNASLRNNFVLGQDEYGSSVNLPLSDLALPIPDLAVGRLVRTAAEVSHMLAVYTASQGQLNPSSSLVTGYDFVADAATNAAADLHAGTGTAPDTLISPQGQSPATSWTANDLRQRLLGGRHDIVFMSGHFSAGALEAADYSTTLSAAEVASSSVDMSNSLVLALGCHGGYSIPGGDAVPNLSPSPDWTEALAEKGATLLASTGYTYGDTVLTEYGEHLFDNYVHQLLVGSGPVAAGAAEVAAKKEYLATHTNLTGVDEKTLLETTLYGLPMLGVNMPSGRISPQSDTPIVSSAPTVASGPGSVLSLASSDVDITPSLTSHSTTLTSSPGGQVTATYLTGPNNGEVARPGEPIFPSQSFNVHVPSLVLRGVGFRGGTYTDTNGITPLTSAVGTETSVGHPAFYTNVFYPTQVGSANYFGALGGGSERLDTTPVQYVSSGPASTSGTFREYSHLTFRLFYLPNSWTSTQNQAAEAAPSQITGVSAVADNSGNVTFSVHVSSDQSAGTQAVWITYTNPNSPGTWQSLDLTQSASDPTSWTLTQNLPSGILFMVQAANGTGLVTLSTNSGAYYTVGTPPSTTTPTTITLQSPPSTGVFQTQSPGFQVHLDAGGMGLGGQAVTLQIGSQQALGTTDSNGNASISLPLNQPPGSYSAVATYAGTTANGTTYLPSSSTSSTFAITGAPTSLSLAPTNGATSPASIMATLTDNTGNALVQRTVLFTVTGGNPTTTYGLAVITDFQGHASLGSLSLPPGIYSVTAAFGGANNPQTLTVGTNSVTESDPDFLTSMAAAVPLTVKANTTVSTSAPNLTYGQTSVSLGARVSSASPAPVVNEGSVSFQLSQGGTKVGTPVTGTVSNGSAGATYTLPVGAVGAYTITATYSDSGPSAIFNGSVGTGSVSILYQPAPTACDGDAGHTILQPVNADGSSVFKQGRTVPLKFRVCNNVGASVGPTATASTVVTYFKIVKAVANCGSCTVDETVNSTTPDTAFRWDATAQQWIFNLSTKNLVSGTSYYYEIGLNDGTVIDFNFAVK